MNELSESLANYMFPGIVDTSSDDVTDVKDDFESAEGNPPVIVVNQEAEQKSTDVKTKPKGELEQDALYQRKRRDLSSVQGKIEKVLGSSKKRSPAKHKSFLDNPFWNFKMDNRDTKYRSRIPAHPIKKQIMSGMLHKRWKIPGKVIHCFAQLVYSNSLSLEPKSFHRALQRWMGALAHKCGSTYCEKA